MDVEKSCRRLFVGGLFQGITEKDLKDRFSRFGEVSGVDVRARKDNLGTILKTFAYLDMLISEKDYRKCMATFNNTKWHGNEMQIQIAKESFVDRLKKEREEAAKIKLAPTKPVSVVEPVDLLVKGAVPGTAVNGKTDWVVGKYGRALPVMNIRTKNKKKVVKVDPSKYVHGVKQFDHGKKVLAAEETQAPVTELTWHMDVEETDITKKIKGEFPPSKRTPKRKHTEETTRTKPVEYHSSSDSSSPEEEIPLIKKKKGTPGKSIPKRGNGKLLVQTPQQSVKTNRKGDISSTSTPTQSSVNADLSPCVTMIEPMTNGTPGKASKALAILQQLKLSAQKNMAGSTNGFKQKAAINTDSSSDDVTQVSKKNSNVKFNSSKKETPKGKIVQSQLSSSSSEASSEDEITADISPKLKVPAKPGLKGRTNQVTSDSCNSEDKKLEKHKLTTPATSTKKRKDVDSKATVQTETAKTTITFGKSEKSVQKKRQVQSLVSSPVLIQFDDDIGRATDDEESSSKPANSRKQPKLQHSLGIQQQQPGFARVGAVDEFGVGMLVDDNTRVLSEIERNWNKYNSRGFSSDEDLLDAASAGKYKKLDGIAKVAALRQKHIDMPSAGKSVPLATSRVYNSESGDSDDNGNAFKKVQQAPKRIKAKSAPHKAKTEPVVANDTPAQRKATGFSSDSDDESSSDEESRLKKAKGASQKRLVRKKSTNKPEESSDEDVDSGTTSKQVRSVSSKSETWQPTKKTEAKGNKKTSIGLMKNLMAESSSGVESSDLETLTSDVSESEDEHKTLGLSTEPSKVNNVFIKDTSHNISKSLTKIHVSKALTVKPVSKQVVISKQKASTSESDESSVPVTDKCSSTKTMVHVSGVTNSASSSESDSSDSDAVQVKEKVLAKNVVATKPDKSSSESESSESNSNHNQPSVGANNLAKITQPPSSENDSSEAETQQINSKQKCKIKQKATSPPSSSESSEDVQNEAGNTKLAETSTESSDSDSSAQLQPMSIKTAVPKPDSKKIEVAVPTKKALKPKITKKFGDSNQQRLDSLKQRSQEALAQKGLLKQALASLDCGNSKSKKIIFDSDSEDEKNVPRTISTSASKKRKVECNSPHSDSSDSGDESLPKSKASKKTKKDEKRPALFAEESEESEGDDENRFNIRPQFEGKAGSKLISMQSRFGNDPRFKFTEKFLDSDAENETGDDSSENEAEGREINVETTERERTMAILNDVVGCKLARKTKPVVFKDIATRQYDPTKDEHKQFEVPAKKKEKKKAVALEESKAEAEPVPEVSGEKYFEVKTSLKDMFNTGGGIDKPFSLLDMLGRSADEHTEKPKLQQADGMGSALNQIKSPWQQQFGSDGDSSEGEQGTELVDKSEPAVMMKDAVKPSTCVVHGFFFVENDPRIAEGIDFFRRHADLEEIRVKWAEERPELVEAYRNKRKRFKFMKRDADTRSTKPGTSRFRGRGRGQGRGGRR